MDCESFARLLGSWMDGKLDLRSRMSMAEHEETCAACGESHAKRLALRNLVRSSRADELVPQLIANIRETVLRPADRAPAGEPARDP